MIFILIVLLTALFIEGIGTYMSVVGLAAIFAANPVIITMAVALDVGKVVAVSFLYRNWKKVRFLMKLYMLIATLVLIVITSTGVFGYLSAEFQKAIQGTSENVVLIEAMQEEQLRLKTRKSEIDAQIAAIPPDFITGREKIIAAFSGEVETLNSRLVEIDEALPTLKIDTIKKNTEVGPIMYIANVFEVDPEIAVKYVILIIIFVFDPLAIVLLVAGNFLIIDRQQKQESAFSSRPRISDLFVAPVAAVPVAAIAEPEVNVHASGATKTYVGDTVSAMTQDEEALQRLRQNVEQPTETEEVEFGPEPVDVIDEKPINEESVEQDNTVAEDIVTEVVDTIAEEILPQEEVNEVEKSETPEKIADPLTIGEEGIGDSPERREVITKEDIMHTSALDSVPASHAEVNYGIPFKKYTDDLTRLFKNT